MERLYCKDCGSSVKLENNNLIKNCTHTDAVVISEFEVIVTGDSELE
jgi:hypothetical protein